MSSEQAMAEDFSAALFAEARARHEAGHRWFWIAVAVLAAFHLMIFSPYLHLAGQKREANSGIEQGAKAKERLNAIRPDLENLREASLGRAKTRLDSLLAELRGSFARLNTVIAELRRLGPDAAAGDEGAQLFQPASVGSMAIQSPLQMQMPIANAAAPRRPEAVQSPLPMQGPIPNAAASARPYEPPLDDMGAVLRRAIAAAQDDRLLELIHAYIEQHIIQPKFARFNGDWRRDAVPKVTGAGNLLLEKIRAARGELSEVGKAPAARDCAGGARDGNGSWGCLEQAVTAVVASSASFTIEPPSDPIWWRTVEGKGAVFGGFLRNLDANAVNPDAAVATLQTRADAALDALHRQTEAALAENKQRLDDTDRRIARLNDDSRKLQEELAALIAPLKSISLDLAILVPYFPIILAASFVGLIGTIASRVEELGFAVATLARDNPATPAVGWLQARILESPWYRWRIVLARFGLLFGWVRLAGGQLAQARLGYGIEAAVSVAAGAVAIAAAGVYEWRVVRSLGRDAGAVRTDAVAA
jgi:hypothetical protein